MAAKERREAFDTVALGYGVMSQAREMGRGIRGSGDWG